MYVKVLNTHIESKEIHLTSETASHHLLQDKADYLFDLESTIRCPSHLDMFVSVAKAELPVSFFNVNENNNILRFKYKGDNEKTIVLQVGNYNINQLLSHLHERFQSDAITQAL